MPTETRRNALRRLKSIQGQLAGIQRMIEEGRYCIDVLTQLRAVQSAMNGVRNLILEGYIHTCMLERIREGDETQAVQEIMSIIKYGD
ncbi:MAG TPA: transcriptional regulator [Anaerolineae bacterium]|nr:transcriptional regulator [Anaerolineae bacterium]